MTPLKVIQISAYMVDSWSEYCLNHVKIGLLLSVWTYSVRAKGSKFSSRITFYVSWSMCPIPGLLKPPSSSLTLHLISQWVWDTSGLCPNITTSWTHQRRRPYSRPLWSNLYSLLQTSAWLFFAFHWWRAFSSFAQLQPCFEPSSPCTSPQLPFGILFV